MPRHILLVSLIGLLTVVHSEPCAAAGPFQDPARQVMAELPSGAMPKEGGKKEPQRLVAATLALTLGTFGAHRLYFGTDAKVPVLYGLTFGGFGVLALIDFGQILFTKDLGAYRKNNKVLMWSKGRSEELTPP